MADIRGIADEVLFPAAVAVDQGRVPVSDQLAVLADTGLYGLHVPVQHGGLGTSRDEALRAVEVLAGGCLTTTFVWIQHQGVVKRMVAAGGGVAEAFLPAMATGEVRAGVAVGGIRSDPPALLAHPTDEGWRLEGTVPWISGWGMVEVILVAAAPADDPGGSVLWLLVHAPQPTDPALALDVDTITLDRYQLVALDHAESARATFTGHPVPADRLLLRQPRDDWQRRDAAGLRTNGSLSLGLAGRCADLAGAPELRRAVDVVRDRLDRAETDQLPAARADAAMLAWDAAGRLLTEHGGRGVAVGQHAERLAREAMVLQVFGTRPSIIAAMRQRSRTRLHR